MFKMAEDSPVTIPHGSKHEAELTRSELYTFRGVLYKSLRHKEIALAAKSLRFTVKDSTLTITSVIQKEDT